jgi:predicted peptidase
MPVLLFRLLSIALLSLPTLAQTRPPIDDFLSGKVSVDAVEYPYALLPPANIVAGQKYPLVLFLHGAGERGIDNQRQKIHFPVRMAGSKYRDRYPCFVLAPQCPENKSWVDVNWSEPKSTPLAATPTGPMLGAISALKEVIHNHPIDRDRISLTGLSMGGYGTWDLAMRYPGWFSTAIPICGGGDERQVARLAGLPMQVWHGGADQVVAPSRSSSIIRAASESGFEIEYHELPGVGHISWPAAYGEGGSVDLLFSASRDPGRIQVASAQLLAREISAKEQIAFLGDSMPM